MQFISPSIEYIDSYLEALKKLEEEGFPDFISSTEIEKDREIAIEKMKLLETEKCVEINSDFTPSAFVWLVDEQKKEYLGRISVRYVLKNEYMKMFGGHIGYTVNPKYRRRGYATMLLKYGIELASKKGIKMILITCNVDNIGSRKVIEKNGGIFINSMYDERNRKHKLRYVINVK